MKHHSSSTDAARLAAVPIQPLTIPAAKTSDHDQWLGWSEEQRRRRLPLVVNNCRSLLLPAPTFSNLASRSLRLCLDRLSADWQARYQHPVLIVETFVDPEQFCGTVYAASGWRELGTTDGFDRVRRDFYVAHHQPKRLFARELYKNARRHLQADQLQPSLALVVLAHLCDTPRGQNDLVKFAKGMSRGQRRALGARRQRDDSYPAPRQPNFCRFLQSVDAVALEALLLRVQTQ